MTTLGGNEQIGTHPKPHEVFVIVIIMQFEVLPLIHFGSAQHVEQTLAGDGCLNEVTFL